MLIIAHNNCCGNAALPTQRSYLVPHPASYQTTTSTNGQEKAQSLLQPAHFEEHFT